MGHVTIINEDISKAKTLAKKIKETVIITNQMNKVAIIMGSKSDLDVMSEAIEILKSFGIKTEHDIVSAHRTPNKMIEYATNAELNGIKVIIAGAGGAAHLPGMVASITSLPVIGVSYKIQKFN